MWDSTEVLYMRGRTRLSSKISTILLTFINSDQVPPAAKRWRLNCKRLYSASAVHKKQQDLAITHLG